MSLPSFLRRHRVAVASTAVVAVAAGSLVAYALASRGYPVRHVDLNDGGIWVTNDRDGLFGRLNKPAAALDAAFYPGGDADSHQLDVVQDGASAAARDLASGELFPVDIAAAKIVEDGGAAVAAGSVVAMSGGTLAVLDPASGKVWAVVEDPATPLGDLTAVDASAQPLASVGPPKVKGASAAMTVGVDGTIHVVASSGELLRIPRSGAGFGTPVKSTVAIEPTAPQITALGDQVVVFDAATGQLVLPGGRTVTVDTSAVLQTPSPGRTSLVFATANALMSVPVTGGDATTLYTVDATTSGVATPTWLAGCFHAAWAASKGVYARACDGLDVKSAVLGAALVKPTFRVNRNAVVLNDRQSGDVWDVSQDKPQKLDRWESVDPKPKDEDENKDSDAPETAEQNKPPDAQDDEFGARPGRTTVLHVLDNDSDPQGFIMAVKSVTDPGVAGVALSIAPDGQTVQIELPGSVTAPVRFGYTVDDGQKTDNATVVVTTTPQDEDTPPALREKAPTYAWTVAAGGRLSIPALADWRDHEGDPIFLTEVGTDTKSAIVSSSTDGRIDVVAPPTAATVPVRFTVSDGVLASPPATVSVTVLDPAATTSVAPIAQADVARGQVGRPIVIRPLDNDLPGADPTNPAAELAIAGAVPSSPRGPVVTDVDEGTVTITPRQAGVITLDYSAAYGNAPFAKGKIRVDVTDPPSSPQKPVAMPDTGVLYGQNPAIIDVLANDFDPSGAVLVVQHAEAVDPAAAVQVAIVSGHWLRVTASSGERSSVPVVLRYTLADGVAGPATGEVTLTSQPKPPTDAPVTRDDVATVRAGDAVTVPVLDNDSTPAGSTLSLQPVVDGQADLAAGQLRVTTIDGKTEGIGAAYVSGNLVRYVPPASVTAPTTALVDYVATNPDAETAIGHVRITITPAPGTANPNQPPVPKALESRVVSGDTVHINVPTSGVDPDGDSVAATGIAVPAGSAAATLGRVTKITATTIDYQAFPAVDAGGTDTLTYRVTDRFGGTGEATVRIAVVQPGDPQPPVAVDDTITAAPGAKVSVDVLANDLRAPDDTVTIEDLGKTNPELAGGVSQQDNVIEATAPDSPSKPLVVLYGATNGLGTPSIGKLTIRSVADYNNPPIALDAYAAPSGQADSVTVDVLARVDDVDGAVGQATLTTFDAKDVSVSGGKVTIKVGSNPQTIPYQVEDQGGAVATAVIHVPAAGSGAPYVKDGTVIRVDQGKTANVEINDYVTDPAGKKLTLTLVDRAWAAPTKGLGQKVTGATTLTLTGLGSYIGPAAVTFEVTDGTSINDPDGVTGVVTVPVQVGPETPVLRCPAAPLTVTQGGEDLGLDITSLCHVWVADPTTKGDLTYSLDWSKQPKDVEVVDNGSHRPAVRPNTNAVTDDTGKATVTVDGTEAAPAELNFVVAAAPPPTVAPITVDGFKANDTATFDLRGYVSSPLKAPDIHVVRVTKTDGEPATVSANGSVVTIRPGADSQGRIGFSVVVTDVSGDDRTDRQVTGRIELNVLNVPDAPSAPVPGRSVISHQVQLSWTAPVANGAPIDSYEVSWNGGSQACASTSCAITGLENGQAYTFTVTAHNAVGDSKPSPASAPATPDEKPDAPTNVQTSDPEDGRLTVSWTASRVDGSPVSKYLVSWGGGGSQTVAGSATTMTATGLDNSHPYTFTVTPFNQLGAGPAGSVTGQSSGAPDAPGNLAFDNANAADGNTRVVSLRWDPVAPNGIAPTTYTVSRTGGGSNKTLCPDTRSASCDDGGVANDGTVYEYTVVAKNEAAKQKPETHTSAPSDALSVEASATPDKVGAVSATPTGNDDTATVTFTVGRSHGPTATVRCRINGESTCGNWNESPAGIDPDGGSATQTVTGFSDGVDTTVEIRECNGSNGGEQAGDQCGPWSDAAHVTTYGPIEEPQDPAISISGCSGHDGTATVNYHWGGGSGNGRPAHYLVDVGDGRGVQRVDTPMPASVDSQYTVGCGGGSVTHRVTVQVELDDGSARSNQHASPTVGEPDNPPPPPPPVSISLERGDSVSRSDCPTNCYWFKASLSNFPTGNFAYSCWNNVDGTYYSSRVTVSSANQVFTSGLCYQQSGFHMPVQITISTYSSNQASW